MEIVLVHVCANAEEIEMEIIPHKTELLLKDECATIHEVSDNVRDIDGVIRFYKSHPNGWTLQIRQTNKLNLFGSGKERMLIASAYLDFEEIEAIYNHAKMDLKK